MDKPGSWHIRSGLLWLAGGALLTWLTFQVVESSFGIVFFGAVLYGAANLAIGLWRRARYALLPAEKKAVAHAEAAWVTLLRCMAMVANADGVADESEIETIGQIYDQIAGSPPPDGQVREMLAAVGTGGDSPQDVVASLGLQAGPESRLLIGRACYLVMSAGGTVEPAEERMFDLILKTLEVPRAGVLGEPGSPSAPPRTAA